MLSTQFLEILNICKEYNIPISYLQASQLCNIEGSVFKRILEDFSNCPLDRKETFVEVLLDRGFMNIYGYEDILSAIANITEEEYEDLFKIITKPNVSKIPKIAQYIKVLYLLANQSMKLHSKEVVAEIAKIVPHTDFGDDADIIKSFLLDSFNSDYEIYGECDDEICFEDEHDGFAEDLEKAFRFHYEDTKLDAHKLLRKIKPENMPRLKPRNQTKNILYLYPKKED